MQSSPHQMPPLIPPAPVVRRQDRRKIGVLTLGIIFGAGAVFLVKVNQTPDNNGLTRNGRPIPEETAAGTLPSAQAELRLPSSYRQVSLLPPPPPSPEPTPLPVTKALLTQDSN